MSARLFKAFASLLLVVFIAGCGSTGSVVSSYGGPSLEKAEIRRSAARNASRDAGKDVKALERTISELERQIARDEKRLVRKKVSKRNKERAADRLARNVPKLKAASRDLRRAQRVQRRADRLTRRADARFERAQRLAEAARVVEANTVPVPEDTGPLRRVGERTASLAGGLFRGSDPAFANIDDYQARVDNGFAISAIPVDKVSPRLFRQQVNYSSNEKPGTVIVDTGAKYLYVVQRGGTAMRYGIGVGREGFAWSGSAHIGFKRQWPKWTPPVEMIERQPELAKYCADCGGMPGGPANPLGARALYLVKDGKDTLYRLHGTPQWGSIGTAASSGCIRLMNQDVIDLYNRVPTGSKVIVI